MANDWAKRFVTKAGVAAKTAMAKSAAPPAAPAPAPAPAARAAAPVVSDPRFMPPGTRMWGQNEAPGRHAPARSPMPRGLVAPIRSSVQLVRVDPTFDEGEFQSRLAALPDIRYVQDVDGVLDLSTMTDDSASEAFLQQAAAIGPRLGHNVVDSKTGQVLNTVNGGAMPNMRGAPLRAFPIQSPPAAISGAQPLGSGVVPRFEEPAKVE